VESEISNIIKFAPFLCVHLQPIPNLFYIYGSYVGILRTLRYEITGRTILTGGCERLATQNKEEWEQIKAPEDLEDGNSVTTATEIN
jgi:hypothetical protein